MSAVLLTRSTAENELIASEIVDLGFTPYFAPMITYNDVNHYAIHPKYSRIIITSKHAAQLATKIVTTPTECWVVGSESALILQNNSLIRITNICKNVEGLLELIAHVPETERSVFFENCVYLSGDVITAELPKYIERQIIYNSVYTKELSDEIIAITQKELIDYCLVYSKNCAANLINLLKKHNLLPYLNNSVVIAIGEQVAHLFDDFAREKLFAKNCSAKEMLELLVKHEKKRNKYK